MATGTFSATGPTDPIIINDSADLSLVFTSTGTVVLEREINGGWREVPDASWTSDTEDIVYTGSFNRKFRLNCTTYADTIDWDFG